MRLCTARRKDPMHLYYKHEDMMIDKYIVMWEILSQMENHFLIYFYKL